MNIISIDTSSKFCSLSIQLSGNIRDSIISNLALSHSSELAVNLKKLINKYQIKISDLDFVLVNVGPGSFTGLRIGVSFAKGLCLSNNIPLIPINSFDMIDSKISRESSTPLETKEAIQKEDISITPIGIPLIAGPGAITSIMILSSQTSSYVDKCIVHINILITLIITYIILLLGKKISKKIGTTGIRIIQRIMGLILLVISIQFIINGILLLMESQSKL